MVNRKRLRKRWRSFAMKALSRARPDLLLMLSYMRHLALIRFVNSMKNISKKVNNYV